MFHLFNLSIKIWSKQFDDILGSLVASNLRFVPAWEGCRGALADAGLRNDSTVTLPGRFIAIVQRSER